VGGDVWDAIGAEAATPVVEVPMEVQEETISHEHDPSVLWGDLLDQAAPITPETESDGQESGDTLGFIEGIDNDPEPTISEGQVKDGPELLSAVTQFDLLELSEVRTAENLREELDGNLSGVLSSDQAKEEVETGFRAIIAAGGNWLINQVAGEPTLTDPLPLIGKSLGEMIAIGGSLNDAIFDAGLGLGSAILESIQNENTNRFGDDLRIGLNQITSDLEFLIDQSRTFGGLLPLDSANFNGAIQDNQILFNAGLIASDQQTVPISLGTAADRQQILLQGETEVQVDVTVQLDLTMGYDLAGTLGERERPFIRLNDLSAAAEVHTEDLEAEALIGCLEAKIQGGEIRLSGEAEVTLNNPDGDAQNRVTQLELEDTQASELYTLRGSGMLEAALPIQASLGDYTPSGTPVIRLTDDNVLAGPPPVVTLQEFDELVDFTHLNAAGFFGVLGQLRNWFGQFSGTDLFETQLPFASDRSIGDALEMGEAFTQAILDPLTETPDPENPNQAQASFQSAQDFIDQLAAAAGVDPATLNPGFDSSTHELTFHLPLQEQWKGQPLSFELEAAASPLAGMTSGSTIQVNASVDGGLTLGMILTPVAAELVGAGDAPANGQLSGDAEFTLTIGEEDPVEVILASDSSNTNVTDLVADFNAALETAGIGHLVMAQRQENRVRVQTISREAPPSLKLETADPNDPILTELHFADGQSDSDTATQHAFVEDVSLTGQVTLSANEIHATGQFGFLSVGIEEGTVTANGTVQVSLAAPATG
jgi:hypothetical protein